MFPYPMANETDVDVIREIMLMPDKHLADVHDCGCDSTDKQVWVRHETYQDVSFRYCPSCLNGLLWYKRLDGEGGHVKRTDASHLKGLL